MTNLDRILKVAESDTRLQTTINIQAVKSGCPQHSVSGYTFDEQSGDSPAFCLDRSIDRMKAQLKLEYEQKGKEYYEKIGKKMLKRLKPRIKKIAEMFQDVELVMDQTLIEGSVNLALDGFFC